MSGPQERSTGVPTGAQPPQSAGNVTGTSGSATGATSASMHDQPTTTRTETTTSYTRGTGSSTGASYGSGRTGMGTESMGLGGVIAMVAGLLAFLTGLAAVVKQSFYPALPGYAYRWNVHGWGWVLLILGGLLFAAGATYLLGMSFGRIAAVALAVCTAVVGFLFLAYTPVWGTIVVAVSVIAIWGLLRDGGRASAGRGGGYGESSMSSGGTTTSRSTRV
jgi:hypothetical protein